MLGIEYNHPIVMETYWVIHWGIFNLFSQIDEFKNELAKTPETAEGYVAQRNLDVKRYWLTLKIDYWEIRIKLLRQALMEMQ